MMLMMLPRWEGSVCVVWLSFPNLFAFPSPPGCCGWYANGRYGRFGEWFLRDSLSLSLSLSVCRCLCRVRSLLFKCLPFRFSIRHAAPRSAVIVACSCLIISSSLTAADAVYAIFFLYVTHIDPPSQV